MLANKEVWAPADPLTVSEVLQFHALLSDQQAPKFERLAAGTTLAMIYGRCRASDLFVVQEVIKDFNADSGYSS